MTRSRQITAALVAAAASVMGVRAHAAITAAPGYAVRTIPTPEPVFGGVVRVGNAVFVGQGAFGAGTERVLRLDGSVATAVATGFNSLGGFDADGAGTLLVVDNCFGSDFGCTGALTGDSLYAIPDAGTRTTAVDAATVAVLPAGTIPSAFDVVAVPGATLVSDGAGPGAGRVLRIVAGVATPLVTGLDYTAGLALDGATLLVGNTDASFVGSVGKYTLAGAPLGPLAGALSGSFGLAVDGAGNALVTGGFTPDFSSSTLVAVDGLGAATERARGFGFSADVHFDAARGAALVVDFGVAAVTAICADADGDRVCDADCTAPAPIAKPKLKIGKQLTPAGDDTLAFKGEMEVAGTPDPVTNGARVLVDDAEGLVVVDVVVPGGAYDKGTKTGWKVNKKSTAWTYKNPAGVVGVTKVAVKAAKKAPGVVKFKVVGKKSGYPAAAATLPVHAVMTLDPAGQCGVATFPGPAPACAFDGKTLKCQ